MNRLAPRIAAMLVGAAALGRAQTAIPIRPLGPIIATAPAFAGGLAVRQLSDGRIVVNDYVARRLVLLDSAMSRQQVILDAKGGGAHSYGEDVGSLIAYPGDSTLFFDPTAISLLVIDPHGGIVRTIAPPNLSDASVLVSETPIVDSRGRLVYQAPPPPLGRGAAAGTPPLNRDSGVIVRVDMRTHSVDTVTRVKLTPRSLPVSGKTPDGLSTITVTINPFATGDDWVAMRDGTVAVIRSQDYHIDWYDLDGNRTAAPQIAHDWHRLSDSEKTGIVDSIRRVYDAQASARAARGTSVSGAATTQTVMNVVSASDLADYVPAFYRGGAQASIDGSLWVRSQFVGMPAGGPVYDVVDRTGRLVDRVQLPGACTLVAVGQSVAYIASREGTGTVLARARIR